MTSKATKKTERHGRQEQANILFKHLHQGKEYPECVLLHRFSCTLRKAIYSTIAHMNKDANQNIKSEQGKPRPRQYNNAYYLNKQPAHEPAVSKLFISPQNHIPMSAKSQTHYSHHHFLSHPYTHLPTYISRNCRQLAKKKLEHRATIMLILEVTNR
jgi:hypothetical protein